MLSNKDKVKAVVIGALAGGIFGVAVNAVESALDMPDVYWSNTTNECVGVVNYANGDDYSCDDLPSKYNKVWVK
tara:strand:- start:15176 stop:15397 length:222 start_codon:yes stop_codon:yes gene_type:complete